MRARCLHDPPVVGRPRTSQVSFKTYGTPRSDASSGAPAGVLGSETTWRSAAYSAFLPRMTRVHSSTLYPAKAPDISLLAGLLAGLLCVFFRQIVRDGRHELLLALVNLPLQLRDGLLAS